MEPSKDAELYPPPLDGISKVCFGTNSASYFILASSWAGSISVYDSVDGTLRIEFGKANENPPLLDCAWIDERQVVAGNSLGQVLLYSMQSTLPTEGQLIGQHTAGVRCVAYSETIESVITASWDSSIQVWDIRDNLSTSKSSASLTGKAFALSLHQNTCIVGTSKRKLEFWDLRKMDKAWNIQESPIRQQIRSIACSPDANRFAIGSTEGRVAIQPFPSLESNGLETSSHASFSFKCHRQSAGAPDGADLVFPVNVICFHPVYGTFATGGGDGVVNIWDGDSKKRIYGSQLAIASSYTFEEGERDHPPDALYVHSVADNEVLPRHFRTE
ncbi:Mitotic checkpoint protein BUB3.2 [Galdieria sulphuraria]|nr:Mitotic checkpoint protein BUB3.2 [Galdieria sulphuraria]